MVKSASLKDVDKSSKQQGSSSLPSGFPSQEDMRQYPTLAVMKELKVPFTREKYLELDYLTPNPQLDAEAESELPEPFRRNL